MSTMRVLVWVMDVVGWFGGGNICFATLRTIIVRAIEFNRRRVISRVLFAGSETWMGNDAAMMMTGFGHFVCGL